MINKKEKLSIEYGVQSNFLKVIFIPDCYKSARNLYPSLLDDPDADGVGANARKALED